MKDFIGNELNVGDMVVHTRRRSSSMWLDLCKIVEIKPKAMKVIKCSSWEGKFDSTPRYSWLHIEEYLAKIHSIPAYIRAIFDPLT